MGKVRCLYDILDVPRDAEDDVIKKAYRRQALIWHPGEGWIGSLAACGVL